MNVNAPDFTESEREHGQQAVDGLIRELGLEPVFGLVPGAPFAAKRP